MCANNRGDLMGKLSFKRAKPVVAAAMIVAGVVFGLKPHLAEAKAKPKPPAAAAKAKLITETRTVREGDTLYSFSNGKGDSVALKAGKIGPNGMGVIFVSEMARSETASATVFVPYGKTYRLGEVPLAITIVPMGVLDIGLASVKVSYPEGYPEGGFGYTEMKETTKTKMRAVEPIK